MADQTTAPARGEPGLALRLLRLRRRLTFVAVRSVLRGVGFAHAGRLGGWAGSLQYRFDGRQRRRLQADIAALLGRPAGDPAVAALLHESYRVNNAAVFEIMALLDRRRSAADLAARCEVGGLEQLRAALDGGRGAILLSAHMGNAALLPVRLASDGWKVAVVFREARMMSAGFFQQGLERYGIEGILANAGIRAYAQMVGALKQNRIVFLMLDQGVKRAEDGLPLRFLGKDVPMSAGPAQLARATRAPLLPVVTTAAAPVWRFDIEAPVVLGVDSLEADTATLVGLTERQVLQHPQLWSWHHRRWRKFPMAARAS
jgi:KDO2-lipid IV(A) lauroyltransferase